MILLKMILLLLKSNLWLTLFFYHQKKKHLYRHKIVLIEGNYLLLDEPPWNTKTFLFDELWYITCDIDIAMKRILLRHMKCFGIINYFLLLIYNL